MRKLLTIFLLTSLFLQTFNLFVIKAYYYSNKSYIARVFCINKEKPRMHCNGKCYLAKQLKEQEQQDKGMANFKFEKFNVQPFYLPGQCVFIPPFSSGVESYYTPQINFRSAFLPSVFHPPLA